MEYLIKIGLFLYIRENVSIWEKCQITMGSCFKSQLIFDTLRYSRTILYLRNKDWLKFIKYNAFTKINNQWWI